MYVIIITQNQKEAIFTGNEKTPVATVCFTGHREIPYEIAESLPEFTKQVVRELIDRGAVSFRNGGALGFDMIAALTVIELKSEFPQIKLDLFLPCRDQFKKWSFEDQKVYAYILENADSYTYIAEEYFSGCMLERDRKMVTGSDVCVAFCMKNSGGTAYTVKYALQNDIEFINVYDRMRGDAWRRQR